MESDALRFTIEGSFCSFREPGGAKYQRTFWFPPKTTIVGFLGAALGLAPPDLEPLYDQVQVGVVLHSWGGLARDLWGYTKLKRGDKPETAVVVRELIYEPQYIVYVTSKELGFLQKLRAALWDPVYPLRFGRGEDLALIRRLSEPVTLQVPSTPTMLRWTLLPFTLEQRRCSLESPTREPPPRMPPRPVHMPIRFTYKPNWVREADFRWMTQVLDWGVQPDITEGMWTDGEQTFYLV
jgi:CRISPR-associated protein Cas5t